MVYINFNFISKWQIFGTLFCYKCKKDKEEDSDDTACVDHNNIHKDHSIKSQNHNSLSHPAQNNTNHNEPNLGHDDEPSNMSPFLSISNLNETHHHQPKADNGSIEHIDEEIEMVKIRFSLGKAIGVPSNENAPSLYPPGRILHIVRKYPNNEEDLNEQGGQEKAPRDDNDANLNSKNSTISGASANNSTINNKNFTSTLRKILSIGKYKKTNSGDSSIKEKRKAVMPVYQVIETDNREFDELLISPRMLQDHIPNNLIKCMKAVN